MSSAPTTKIRPSLAVEFYVALVHSTTTKIITSSLIVAPPSLLHYDALSLKHAIEEEIITLEHEGSLK